MGKDHIPPERHSPNADGRGLLEQEREYADAQVLLGEAARNKAEQGRRLAEEAREIRE